MLLIKYHHSKMYRVVRGIIEDDDATMDALCNIYTMSFHILYRFYGQTSFFFWLLSTSIAEVKRMKNAYQKDDHQRADELVNRRLIAVLKKELNLSTRKISLCLNVPAADIQKQLSFSRLKESKAALTDSTKLLQLDIDPWAKKWMNDILQARKDNSQLNHKNMGSLHEEQTDNATIADIRQEHLDNLTVCRNIRHGFMKGIEMDRIKRYVDWYWQSHLMTHFVSEEKMIFPLLGKENALVKRALTEHRRLKRLFESKADINKMLNRIEEELESHVLFEEKVLFKEIEKSSNTHQLEIVERLHDHHGNVQDTWADEFWK